MRRSGNVKISKSLVPPETTGKYYRLLCMTGKDKGISYYLISNRIVMGRSSEVDVEVVDSKSSREHAEIVKVGKDYVITDLNSQNGIFVNDLKITQHILSNNDKIIIGHTVYKYNVYDIVSQFDLKKVNDENDQDNENGEIDENIKPKKKGNKSLVYGVIILGGVYLILSGSPGDEEKIKKKNTNYSKSARRSGNESFVDALIKKEATQDKEVTKQLANILHKGQREFREGNYFRAIEEFNLALRLSPSDGRSTFYLNRTKQRLDEEIEENFLNGRQSEDALKYKSALISYCTILRLIRAYPDDKRFSRAENAISNIENKLGLDQGDFECIKK